MATLLPAIYLIWFGLGGNMRLRKSQLLHVCFRFVLPSLLLALLLCPVGLFAQSQVMGEVSFNGKTRVEKNAGVWIDGTYVGYLKELKGKKKVLLLPGTHEITARFSGYQDFTRKIIVEPGQKELVSVVLHLVPGSTVPNVTSSLRLDIQPRRAAVFLDGRYVGHVDEFDGKSSPLLMSAGIHRVKIELPGYQVFETEVNLLPNQKSELKTELVKGSIEQAGSLIRRPESE